MSDLIIHLGLDVHKESITVAVLPGAAAAPTRVDRLPNELPKLQRIWPGWRAMARSGFAMRRAAPASCCIGPYAPGAITVTSLPLP